MHHVTLAPTEFIVVLCLIGQENRFVITQPRTEADILSRSKYLDKVNRLVNPQLSTILSSYNDKAKPA